MKQIEKSLKTFFKNNSKVFAGKKVCVVIPDNTRVFHPKLVLPCIAENLGKISKKTDFIISLGLHRKLGRNELEAFLGKRFIKANKVIQHSTEDVKYFSKIRNIPLYLNKNIFSYDVIFTVGVVEPHLYAGFSGGIKCIAVGLAGKKTILKTHSTSFLSRKGVCFANIKDNPFHEFLQQACKKVAVPIYSLNVVNNIDKTLAFYSLGNAGRAFLEAVKFAKEFFSCKVKEKFDCVFVGCDFPKDKNLYQTSRLFNYMLDKKPLVKKGGAIFVFARLDSKKKSKAEKNFENLLQKRSISKTHKFKKPGEHRAFKVLEASGYACLAIITPNIPKEKFSDILFFKNYAMALKWAKGFYGNNAKLGVIPSGFSFIPV